VVKEAVDDVKRTLNGRIKNSQSYSKEKGGKAMDNTTLIILIIVLVLLFGGGGGYYWRRRG
jgi:hypothetical protein